MTDHRGDTRRAENLLSAVPASIDEHLEEHREVPGRRRKARVTQIKFVQLGSIYPRIHGIRFGRRHSRRAIHAPLAQGGWKHEVAVLHAERFKEPRSDELPERLTTDATNDVTQQEIAEIRIDHRGAGAAR